MSLTQWLLSLLATTEPDPGGLSGALLSLLVASRLEARSLTAHLLQLLLARLGLLLTCLLSLLAWLLVLLASWLAFLHLLYPGLLLLGLSCGLANPLTRSVSLLLLPAPPTQQFKVLIIE